MSKIGIYFGTDTGTTRLMAKKMAKKLANKFGSDLADKPLNVNRIEAQDMLQYDALILGTPTYGDGIMPGIDTGAKNGSWQEFAEQFSRLDLSGKKVALYGLGNQEKYPDRFAEGLYHLYQLVKDCGATIVGQWSIEGYEFNQSKAVVDGEFIGLVIDNNSQGMLTESRLDTWLEQVSPLLLN